MRLFVLYGAFSIAILAFCACNDGKRNIRAYYFPVDELSTGRVYHYQSVSGDTSDHIYWYYRSSEHDGSAYLTGTQYDRHFRTSQTVKEKVVQNGVLASDYFLYETDTATGKDQPIRATLESANTFPFEVSDSLGVFLFSLRYHLPDDSSSTIYLVRNRRFLGGAPPFEFQGRQYPCVRFGLREVIGNRREGSAEIDGSGEEWYAEGLGLVYYRKAYSEGKLVLEYRLKETFPMQELERRSGQSH